MFISTLIICLTRPKLHPWHEIWCFMSQVGIHVFQCDFFDNAKAWIKTDLLRSEWIGWSEHFHVIWSVYILDRLWIIPISNHSNNSTVVIKFKMWFWQKIYCYSVNHIKVFFCKSRKISTLLDSVSKSSTWRFLRRSLQRGVRLLLKQGWPKIWNEPIFNIYVLDDSS